MSEPYCERRFEKAGSSMSAPDIVDEARRWLRHAIEDLDRDVAEGALQNAVCGS